LNKINRNSVQKLIDKTLAVYQADAARVIADYRAEKQYTADYEGRQILELLQNADDAETEHIHIEINTSTNSLIISNNGVPFSIDGVKSLMLANMSPKNKKEYIGNKGLGFRSILNWVKKVEVVTQETILEFSASYAAKKYSTVCELNPELIKDVNSDKNLSKDEIPFAVLAIPNTKTVEEKNNWVTSIRLHYKDEEVESIKSQLDTINEATLLFLKHANKISVKSNYASERVYTKSVISDKKVRVNSKTWNIHHSGELTYEEGKVFSYQIAWQDDLSDVDGVFYTYFPTDMKTHLPCLIHATFDLNASRKEINTSKENLHILNEISKTLGEIAITRFNKINCSWQPYDFLYPVSKSDSKVLKEFFSSIEELRKTLPIYPSTDGGYYLKEEIRQYGDSFSSWVEKNNVGSYFQRLLKPVNQRVVQQIYWLVPNGNYTAEEFHSSFSSLNTLLSDNSERAELIKLLLDSRFKTIHNSKLTMPLLIDRETKRPTNDQVFTIRKDDGSAIQPPEYITGMSFIDSDFYDILIETLDEEIRKNRNEKEQISRTLKRIIDKVVNIGSNDIIDVIRFVAKETENQLKQLGVDRKNRIKDLVNFLFEVFVRNTDRKGVLPITIPLINRRSEIVNGNDLFFGSEFKKGQITEFIFDGIYFDQDYLIGNDFWKLNFESDDDTSAFFTWIGVNSYLKFYRDTSDITPPLKYQQHVFKNRPDVQKSYNYFKGTKILDESIITKLSIEKLLVLLTKDSVLRTQLSDAHSDVYKYKYGSGYPKQLHGISSFIEFQIKSNINFSEYIVENELGIDQLFKSVNFSNELFTRFNVYEGEVKSLLQRFGAIKSLDHISLDQFYLLFNQQSELFPDGKGSSTFYKRFLEFCTKNKEINDYENTFDFENFQCFARKGGRKENKIELRNVSEIYYSDNNLVPKDVLDKFWMLYLPNRLGEKNVKKYFGVNLISKVLETITIESLELSEYNSDFNSHIQTLKPYYLYYRLISIKDKSVRKEAVNLTKNIDIKIVDRCSYRFETGESFNLQENFFIKIDNTFYVNNSNSVDVLINDIVFCDTIAEIFGTHYKVKEFHGMYRSIFKDGIKDTEYIIHSNDGEEKLLEANAWLGISSLENTFWRNLHLTLNKIAPSKIRNQEELILILKENFNYDLPDYYHLVDFNNISKTETVNFLKEIEGVFSIFLEKLITWKTTGFSNFYLELLKDLTRDYRKEFKSLLWNKLSQSQSIELQKKFISQVIEYNDIFNNEGKCQDVLAQNHLNTLWDNEKFFRKLIEEKFGLSNFTISENIAEPINLYKNLILESKIEEAEIPKDLKSLLYFEGHENLIEKYIEQHSNDELEQKKEIEQNTIVGNLHTAESKKGKFKVSKNTANYGWSHGKKDLNKNKYAGMKAEKIAYNTLVDKYGADNVQWMSSFSETSLDKADSYHFDIAYKIEGTWKYLEVKSFNGKYFYLSREEKAFGSKYPEKYEIALVTGIDVFIFKDMFRKDIDFENNQHYKAMPSDYIISLRIVNNN
jgi:hypothetical protein